jgi:hypothetical protein
MRVQVTLPDLTTGQGKSPTEVTAIIDHDVVFFHNRGENDHLS